jgi:hypothetical protein
MRVGYVLIPILGTLAVGLSSHVKPSVYGSDEQKTNSAKLPRLTAFYSEVRNLVHSYYPKATSHLLKDKIHFEDNTRIFIVHLPDMGGEWQDPVEERGPKKRGILCEMGLRPGEYGGAAAVPQTFDRHYFKVLLMAPHSKKHDCFLYVHLYYPPNVSPKFLKEFQDLINDFEKHLEVEK